MKNNLIIRYLYYTSILLSLLNLYIIYLLIYVVIDSPFLITTSFIFILSSISVIFFIIETTRIIKSKNVSKVFIFITFILLLLSSTSFFYTSLSGKLFISVLNSGYQEKESIVKNEIEKTTNEVNSLQSIKLSDGEQFIKIDNRMIRDYENITPKYNGQCFSKSIMNMSDEEKNDFYGRLGIEPQFNDFLSICNFDNIYIGFTMSNNSNPLGSSLYDVWAYNDLGSEKLITLPTDVTGFELLTSSQGDYYILVEDEVEIDVPHLDYMINGYKLLMIEKNEGLGLKNVQVDDNVINICRKDRTQNLNCDEKIYLAE